jgi:hypothetical protein
LLASTIMPGDTMQRMNDGQPFPVTVVPVEGLLIGVEHSGTGTVSVSLPVPPEFNVAVTAVVLDAGYGLSVTSGASLTFTSSNWSTPQTVTFTVTSPGSFRVMFRPTGTDIPGYQSTVIRVEAS